MPGPLTQPQSTTSRCSAGGGFSAVIIGRNEGARLAASIRSAGQTQQIVYVDSGSSDNSVQIAKELGAAVLQLDPCLPFTAARARNEGFRYLKSLAGHTPFVQFVDGDTALHGDWLEYAAAYLREHNDVAVVTGRLRERNPDQSIYNWLCEREWEGPEGEIRACGGIAMMRAGSFDSVGGFRDDLIAGEEPELCIRLRAQGWKVWRLGVEMGVHDAAIFSFAQWFRRASRSGHAFAQGAYLHGAGPEKHRVWETRRAWFWGMALPLLCIVAALAFGPWGLLLALLYPFQVVRQTMRNRGSLPERFLLAVFHLVARFAEASGQLRFVFDRLLGRQATLIEYK